MIAYFVTQDNQDTVVIPDRDVVRRVDRSVLRHYLADEPDFESWQGEPLAGRAPADFGTILASREDEAPPDILDQALWNHRVMAQLKVR